MTNIYPWMKKVWLGWLGFKSLGGGGVEESL